MPEVKTLTAIATSSVGTVFFFPVPSHLKLSLDESAAKKRLNAIGASPVANRFVFFNLKENYNCILQKWSHTDRLMSQEAINRLLPDAVFFFSF